MKAYKDNKARITSIVHVPNLDPDTFGQDLSRTLQDRVTLTRHWQTLSSRL